MTLDRASGPWYGAQMATRLPASAASGTGDLAEVVEKIVVAAGAPRPRREFRFAPPRRWRFDLAWPEMMLAIELEGGTRGRPVTCHACGSRVRARQRDGSVGRELRIGGAHGRARVDSDAEKYNVAALAGWRVLRYTTAMVEQHWFVADLWSLGMVRADLKWIGSPSKGGP